MAKVVCFDIDGVLTKETDTNHQDLAGSYIYRSPNPVAKETMRKAYDAGFTVILHTGRREAHRRITEDWLHAHGFHFHFLFMGKPYFTKVIDDRVCGVTVDQQLEAFEKDFLNG
jgi:uncharacterized HAD superfamily protein